MEYRPMMNDDEIALRVNWHNNNYVPVDKQKTIHRQYLKRRFIVPKEVFPPAWMSKLLGKTILDVVKEGDKVLDMGTGCGVNAILAASKSTHVLGVDINPYAIEAAKHNAKINNVSSRTEFIESDLFQNVRGRFDLIIFDPPFRWFKPRDVRDMATTDENFVTMRAFFDQVKNYMTENGRIAVFYGDSGDLNYFLSLVERAGLKKQLMRSRAIIKDGRKWRYFAWILTAPS